jgi:hypothetical protein
MLLHVCFNDHATFRRAATTCFECGSIAYLLDDLEQGAHFIDWLERCFKLLVLDCSGMLAMRLRLVGLQGLRDLDVPKHRNHVKFSAQHLHVVDDGRAHHPKGMRNDGVEFARKVLHVHCTVRANVGNKCMFTLNEAL